MAPRGVFKGAATEQNRHDFYAVTTAIGLTYEETLAPSRVGDSYRSGFSFHSTLEDKGELRELARHFETTEAGLIRVCYKIGMAVMRDETFGVINDGD
jgi:hypothetical protein